MQFGMYLVDNGVITTEEFYEALKLQLKTRPQLGALAIERHMLSARQVFEILRAQRDAPEGLFGDIAVRLGYLTEEDLARLLHQQNARVRAFGAILVESGILAPEEVESHLGEYREILEEAQEWLVLS